MLKYLSKITMDILPSVVATILGAYIVNHYISNKPDVPVAAAVSPATPDKSDTGRADVASLPQPGVRAKGISEKAVFEKPITAKPAEKAAEKPQEKAAEKPSEKAVEKAAEKSSEPIEDKPAETASIPAEPKHQAGPREKTAIRTIPLTASPAAPTVQPAASAVVAPTPAATVEAAVTPEDHRDANDLARAAIERLRGTNSPRATETPRAVVAPQVPVSQQAAAPYIRPLPPPIMVSTPPVEPFAPAAGSSPNQPPYANSARNDDPNRPTPPADIPPARPLDLITGPLGPPVRGATNVAQDMLLAAKSMFHAVLPQ